MDSFYLSITLLLITYVVYCVLLYFSSLFGAFIATKTVRKMRNDLFGKIVYLPISYLDSHFHGDLLSRMTNDIDNVYNAISSSITSLVSGILTILGCLGIMLWHSPLLTLVSIAVLILTLLFAKFMSKYARPLFVKQQAVLGKLNTETEEMVTGFKTVKTNNHESYAIEEFGKFTFSYSIGHALLLLSGAISTIVFPKMIDKLSSKNLEEVDHVLTTVRISYISATYFLVFLALPFFPVLLYFLPKYQDAIYALNLIALAVLINTNSFGYSALLIARNKENYSALISFLSLIINVCIALLLVNVFHVGYGLVILSIMFTYLFFTISSTYIGTKLLGQYSLKRVFSDTFPFRLLIPYIAAVFLSVYEQEKFIFMPLLLYLILNKKDIVLIANYLKRMMFNQNLTDL